MTTARKPVKTLITAMMWLMLLSIPAAFAQTLEEAKSAGLIGEKNNGYIGLVQTSAPAAVVRLVEDVNRQRRERYEQIARENGITVDQVAKLAYARAVEATQSGHIVEDGSGRWVRKP
ncbi:MAG: YdbL family protein [Pseudohongiella sp.]|nr:YdbL family protein [Pseudohongiella sp.]MDO9520871.1 YdbL family protein [Pseudohongiella sp.]MDP2128066.1 YdbL family protein [Pseudohongiella sp.]